MRYQTNHSFYDGKVIGKNKIVTVFIHPCGLLHLFGTGMSLSLPELSGQEMCKELIQKLNGAVENEQVTRVMNTFFQSGPVGACRNYKGYRQEGEHLYRPV